MEIITKKRRKIAKDAIMINMKKNILNYVMFLMLLVLLTGCSTTNKRDEFDDLVDTEDEVLSKQYTKISCETPKYIDTAYYIYIESGKNIATIEFDEETSKVHRYTWNLDLTFVKSATNETMKEHAEKFDNFCNEDNDGRYKSCTYKNNSNGRKYSVITGEYDLSKISNLPTSLEAAKSFLESRHGLTCHIEK